MPAKNLPIAYDFHGDQPFELPFNQICPEEIHVYLDIDTNTGKNFCGQNCSHCWFVNYQKANKKSFDMHEGRLMQLALERAGYKVFARYVDSFAQGGDFMRVYGPAHNREFRHGEHHEPTKTMVKGDAWTSGRPLLGENYRELLDLARESGYGTISITFHGVLDENLRLRDARSYPIKGVFPGADTEKVIARIHAYNALQSPEDRMRINIGVTLGSHNGSRESLARYARYFNKLRVDTVRFNNFNDHAGRHPHLLNDDEEVARVYRDLKWLHESVEMRFQMAVSEDFGSLGVDVMGFPAHVGWCRAGRQLFTVIPSEVRLLSEKNGIRTEKIGDIVACVNIFEPHLGVFIRETKLDSGAKDYRLAFDERAIDEFSRQRTTGVYKNGCFLRELLAEKPLELTQQAQSALTRDAIEKRQPAEANA